MENGTDVKAWLAAAVAWLLAGSVWAQQMAPVNPAFAWWQRERAAKGSSQETETVKPRAVRAAAVRGEAGGEDMDFGFVPTVLDTGYLSTLNDNLTQGVGDAPPEVYDLREEGALTPVRDQGSYGNCWAFATMGSLESWIKKSESVALDLSENHLVNLHGWSQRFGAGGNAQMAEAYLLRWAGPVAESEDAYPRPEKSVAGTVLRHVQRVRWIPGKTGYLDNDGIKAALVAYGALQASYYHSAGYYNPMTASYYFDSGTSFRLENHAVDLVGWDDNYPRKHFKIQPPGDGAYIVRNSWGSGWGDGGYFHVSYYDESFAWGPLYSYSSAEPVDNYDGIYQYDPLGMVGSVGYNGPTAWGANIFTATEASKVAAAGFYAMTPRTTYNLYVYTGCKAGEPRSGTLAAQQSGTVDLAGYATVPLETPASVAAGQRFSVVLQLTTPGYAYPLATEYAVAGYSSAATAGAGQSFLSANGAAWNDFTKRVSSTANFCCKAYVKSAVAARTLAGLSIDGVNSLKAGSSASFSCTASYSDGSVKPVDPAWDIAEGTEWASVAADGTVTANAVDEQRAVTLRATYTEDGVTVSATWKLHVTVAAPAVPEGLTATQGTEESCVRLAWNASAGAASYAVYRGTKENAGNAAYLGTVTVTRYADTTALPGVDYRYFVKAKNGFGSSAFGEGAWGWRALAAPTGFVASDGSREDRVDLAWNRSEGASFYRIWRAEGADADFEPLSEWQTACQYADETAEPETAYTYSVTAALDADGTRESAFAIPDEGWRSGPKVLKSVDISGPVSLLSGARGTYICTALYSDGARTPVVPEWALEGGTLAIEDGNAIVTAPPASENTVLELSAEYADDVVRTASLRIMVTPTTPAAPATLELVSATADGIALRWSAVADASSYQVWRATSDGEHSVVASTTATEYTDASAFPGVAYTYRVAAANAAGAGAPGDVVVTATRPIAAPGGVSASYGTYPDKVLVSWTASEGAAFYRVWRSESAEGEKAALGDWQAELAFEDTAAVAGVLYYYAVQAAANDSGLAASAFGGPAVGMRKVAPKPTELTILGPTSVAAESTAAYTAKVSYDNASVRTVTPVWYLASGGGFASIGADGLLEVGALDEDRTVEVAARFTDEGTTVEAVLAVTLVAPVVKSATVSALSAHARWPWNGWVDVDYTLETAPSGTVAKISLSGYDMDHQTALAATTLSGDGGRRETVGSGTHRLSWNLGADYPDFHASQVTVSLNAVPSEPIDPEEPSTPTFLRGGLSAAFYDLNTTAFPYSRWCASYDDMMAYFAPLKPSTTTNTVYVGGDFDFGFTGWYGTCAFAGKYGKYAADDFAALFTGRIEIPETGTYRFHILSDDGIALYIDRQLACGTTGEATGTYDGTITLDAGLHDVALAFHERGERQGLQVNWQTPSSSVQAVLPQNVLFYSGDDNGGDGPGPDDPHPQTCGLSVQFFDLDTTESPYSTWKSSQADMLGFFDALSETLATNTAYLGKYFDFGFTGWYGTCAFPGKYADYDADDFAALFRGSIDVPETGTYQFQVVSDDGIALYIDQQLTCGTTGKEVNGIHDGAIALTAGKHEVALAYHERSERQGLQMYWQIPSADELVLLPQSVLHPGKVGDEDEPVLPANRNGGWAVKFFDLDTTESPYSTWKASQTDMLGFFDALSSTLATNTAYLGKCFDFGFTGWYGTCAFPGKYADYDADDFAALFTGSIDVPETGTYQFQVVSDDGIALYIDQQLTCGTTGKEVNGIHDGAIELTAGKHEVALAYHERGERQGLQMYWQIPSADELTLLPQSVLSFTVEEEDQVTPLDFPDGLVAYWPFDGNAKDASGNGNDGTVSGASLVKDRNGKANGAYYFDGNDSIEVLDSASLRSPTNAISISAWVNPEVQNCVVICKGVNKRQYGFCWDAQSIYINDWCGESRVDVICHNCPSLPVIGIWQYVVATWDGETMIVYINGKKIDEESASGIWASNSINLFIGKDSPGSTEYYSGYLDDLAIWNRALTADEVAQLYAGERQGSEPVQPSLSDGLVAYWPFDGNAKDTSGNGNDGTVNGATPTSDRNGKANGAYAFDRNE